MTAAKLPFEVARSLQLLTHVRHPHAKVIYTQELGSHHEDENPVPGNWSPVVFPYQDPPQNKAIARECSLVTGQRWCRSHCTLWRTCIKDCTWILQLVKFVYSKLLGQLILDPAHDLTKHPHKCNHILQQHCLSQVSRFVVLENCEQLMQTRNNRSCEPNSLQRLPQLFGVAVRETPLFSQQRVGCAWEACCIQGHLATKKN